jgi:biotin carboxylase
MRVLLSDGSGLTARQAATQVAAAGHTVEVLTPDRLALTRFTSRVAAIHNVPAYGPDPLRWLDAALRLLLTVRHKFDVFLPTQEQAAVLSLFSQRVRATGVGLAVPPFTSLLRVQDKLAATRTLRQLGLPIPESVVAPTPEQLMAVAKPPVFVKTPIGTATLGVRRVDDVQSLRQVAQELVRVGAFELGGVVLQRPTTGPLVMIQAVFANGKLLGSHTNVREREGANGGASNKRSIDLPVVRWHLRMLGRALDWTGALALDAILTPDGPCYIDVNPRLVEPGNAWWSGVDLVDIMLRVSIGETVGPILPGQSGIRTHQLLLAVLAAATRGRGAVLREFVDATQGRGPYHDSHEELSPLRGDPLAGVPLAIASAAILAQPAAWRWFASGAVSNYALTARGWQMILDAAAAATTGPVG